MNVLLTGGAGYIGSHTTISLMEAGYSVVIYDNFCNSSRAVLNNLGYILGASISCVEGDIRDHALLESTIRNYQIDAVIHFAGLKAVGESVLMPLSYYDNNVIGTLGLISVMSSLNVKKLVFSSSATVYGDPQYLPIDEKHPLSPTNPYGRTKLQIEQILEDMTVADPAWKVINLRYFNPAGAHDSNLLGENPKSTPNNLMPYIARVAAGELDSLDVFGNDYPTKDGTGVRDYIHVVDLADGHKAALSYIHGHSDCSFETFNLGTGIGYSVYDMISAYECASKRTIPYNVIGRRPGDIASCIASVNKANNILGWKAYKNLEDMCLTSWRFQSHLYDNNLLKNF